MQSLGYHVKLWLDYFVFLQLDFVVRRGEQDTHPGLTPISRIHRSFSNEVKSRAKNQFGQCR